MFRNEMDVRKEKKGMLYSKHDSKIKMAKLNFNSTLKELESRSA